MGTLDYIAIGVLIVSIAQLGARLAYATQPITRGRQSSTRGTTPARRRRPEMENIGAILFAVMLYVITTELWLFVARQRRRSVLRQTTAAGNGGSLRRLCCDSIDYGGGKRRAVTSGGFDFLT